MRELMSYGNGKLISLGDYCLRHGNPSSGIRVPYYASGYFIPYYWGSDYTATTAFLSGSNSYTAMGRFVDFYNIPTFTSTDHWAHENTWFSKGGLQDDYYWTINVTNGTMVNRPMFVDEFHYDWRLSVDTNDLDPAYNGYKYSSGNSLIFPTQSRTFSPGETISYAQSVTISSMPETNVRLTAPMVDFSMSNTSIYTTPYHITIGTRANEWHLSGYMRVLAENNVSYSSNMPNPFGG